MTTKKRARKSAPKKTAAKAGKAPKSAKRSSVPKKEVSQSAINLINQGASLLRKAVLKAESGTVEGRKVVKTRGIDLIDQTSKALHSLINASSGTVTKGLKKL